MFLKRSSFIVKIARWIQRLPISWLRFIEMPFVYVLKQQKSKPYIIILLALPRSGSTLTYQSIIHRFQLLYLSNIGNLLFQLPLIGGWLSHFQCNKYQSNFISNQGFVHGLCGPAEGLKYWRYWLDCGLDDRQPALLDEYILNKRSQYIHKILSILSCPKSPVVSGYLGHTLLPHRVQKTFPEAIIVRLHRDPVSNALSILRCRRKSDSEWFSLFPRECETVIGQDEYKEVAAQVYWLNRRLNDGLIDDNVFHLNYEDLCQNPHSQLNNLVLFCNQRGMSINIKRDMPNVFDYKVADIKNDPDAIKISNALVELENRYGKL